MTNRECHLKAVEAFLVLDEALRPFVKREMIAVHKEKWLDYIANSVKWEREEPVWDTLALLHTIRINWPNVFQMERLRGPDEQGNVSALIAWRHKIQAHSSKIVSKDEAESAIKSILHLLKHICASAQVDEIEKILLSFQSQILPPVAVLPPISDVVLAEPHDEAASNTNGLDAPGTSDSADETTSPGQKTQKDVSSTTSPVSPIEVVPAPEKPPVMEQHITESLPSTTGKLRVECIKDTKTKWWLLQIYDGDTFIGSHERSGSEDQARMKEPEIHCAIIELRDAFKKNNNQPFVVRYTGDAIDEEGKKGVKQIRSNTSTTSIVLGTIPRECWWTKLGK